ncbi:MAG: hypothetical protein GVY16_11725 [Planctomycetes bacterium]|jgi:hypothetical protein|nr:hypothetical protein [Planctomycetota bacterium]
MKKRTYHIRRVDDGNRHAWPILEALAAFVGVTVFLLYLLLLGTEGVLPAVGAGVVTGLAARAIVGAVLALQWRGMTVELDPLDDDADEEESHTDAPDEDEIPMAEPAEPEPAKPTWYDMPYPDPDEEEPEDAETPEADAGDAKHWSEDGYPDGDGERS